MENTLGEYDPEYAQKTFERAERIKFDKRYFEKFIVSGNENLLNKKDRQRMYLANHLSHMDPALAWLNFHREGIRMPMIPAGINLDQDFLKNRDLDLGRLGAYFIDRDLIKKDTPEAIAHKKEVIYTTRKFIKDGLDLLVFPEGGRKNEGELFHDYDEGILRIALNKAKNIDIVPVAFAYDNRVEEKFMPIVRRGNRESQLGKILYYGADALSFIVRPIAKAIGCNVGNAYMNIGEPKPLSKITGRFNFSKDKRVEAVKKFSIEEIGRLYEEIKDR